MQKYKSIEIFEWIDNGVTALCPKCGIDAVLPYNLGDTVLKQMHDYWFGLKKDASRSYQMKNGKSLSQSKAVVLEDDHVDLNDLCHRANSMAIEKGFWDETPDEPGRLTSLGSKIALVHCEVSEAMEEYRKHHPLNEIRIEEGKPEGWAIELADIIIRVCDLAEHTQVNLGAAVNVKLRFNETRPVLHGKRL
jgi:NTP pyrophosphatase (non-canonical NTP hydrolase)